MLSTIFKLYDIRGKYPSQINEMVVFDIMRKFPLLFGAGTRVIIGHDARHSSPSLYKTAIKTLREMNYAVIGVGMITTPMLMFLARNFKFKKDIGIMITASHNPKNQNGIKIIDEHLNVMGGRELFDRMMCSGAKDKERKSKRQPPLQKKEIETKKEYVRFLEKFFLKKNLGANCGSRLKHRGKLCVVIDCSNGSAGPILTKIKFPSWIRAILLNTKPNGNFPAHSPNPLDESALFDAKKAVKKYSADVGVVLDGDGDRIVFVDNVGSRIRPEYIWRLIAGNEKYTRSVVTELNAYLTDVLIGEGSLHRMRRYKSNVGRVSLLRAMKRYDGQIGFENSGHYYFKDFFYSDCGILTLIKAVHALRALPYSLADFVRMLPHTARLPEYNISMDAPSGAFYRTLARKISVKQSKVSFFEGMGMYIKGAYINVRASNTEKEMRINVEGDDAKKVGELLQKTVKMVKKMNI